MKTISDYSIYCTLSQTKKALELGAPIEKKEIQVCDNAKHFFWYDGFYYNYPTAEQIINWLEDSSSIENISIDKTEKWQFTIWADQEDPDCASGFDTRKEATLASIDVALDYLTNNKQL